MSPNVKMGRPEKYKNIYNPEIAIRLKKARKECNLSQSNVAQKLYLTKSAIANWEQGIRDIPYEKLQQLAEYYEKLSDCKSSWIMAEDFKPFADFLIEYFTTELLVVYCPNNLITKEEYIDFIKEWNEQTLKNKNSHSFTYKIDWDEINAFYEPCSKIIQNNADKFPQSDKYIKEHEKLINLVSEISNLKLKEYGIDSSKIIHCVPLEECIYESIFNILALYSGDSDILNVQRIIKDKYRLYIDYIKDHKLERR